MYAVFAALGGPRLRLQGGMCSASPIYSDTAHLEVM